MRRLTLMLASLALVSTIACKGGEDETDTDTDADDNTACESTDGQSPSILSATIRCEPPLQDDQPPFLYMNITATDPQGDFTLNRFGENTFRAYLAANDALQHEETVITCDQDNAGTCSGSISGAQIGVSCGTMDTFNFTAQIADDESNLSPECPMQVED